MGLNDFFQNKELIQILSDELRGRSASYIFENREILYVVQNVKGFNIAEFLPFGLYFPSNIKVNSSLITELIENHSYSKIIINENPLSNNISSIKTDLLKSGFNIHPKETHVLFLNQKIETIVKNKFNDTRQKHIKRYLKNNHIRVFNTQDPAYFARYISIYNDSIKRWGDSLPGYSKTMIENLYRVPNIKLWVAEYQGEMIAGMIVFYSDEGVFDWLAAASIDDTNKKLYAAVAVQYEVIRHACENNYTYVNMGASEKLPGVMNFKNSWGAEVIKYNSYIYEKLLFRAVKAIRHFIK